MVLFLCLNLAVPPGLMAQEAKEEAAKQEGPAFRPEEIDQVVAPIALYPDSLLAQIMVASTYPLEIVQAGRFVQQNKDLKGERLLQAAKDKDWDPSVKAMLEFPDVLLMMSEKLEWTEKLGNAFLSQQKDVMTSVQRLRTKAQEAGNLKTTKEQVVKVEKETQIIVIESASPQVVYVPTYNPTVVYGVWAYPAYPPPPVYAYPYGAGLAFAAGVAVGAAWSGHGGWGCGWGNNEVDVNVSKQNNFTKNNYNNSQKYQKKEGGKNQNWQHNPEHRKGAKYPNQNTAQKYGQQRSGSGGRATTSDARGYGSGGGQRGGGGPQTSDVSRGAGEKGGGKTQTSDLSRGGGKESAFGGSGKGGSERASSNRGSESRSSASRSTSSAGGSKGSGSGGSRSSGGGSSSSGGGSRGGGGGGGRR
jgi:hypothetical protein